MNMRSSLLAASLLFFISATALAQDETDALRYSFLVPQGTARSMGFGSALGSVGGDFSSLSVNPAGIGVYRRSEFMFTPSLKFNNTQGRYLNGVDDDSRTAFNFSNVGLILTRSEKGKRYEKSNWKAVSFGIGINRLADFNRTYSYSGQMKGPNASSFSEIFAVDANQYPGDVTTNGTLAYLGYQSYLLDTSGGSYYTLANWNTGLNQLRSVTEKGGISEIVFSLGGNYQEKLMIGATLGLPSVRYSRDAFFEETDASGDANNGFESFRYSESLSTTGLGVNLKLGLIYKPSDFFRVGAAIHTPTWYSLQDEFNESLTANTEVPYGVNTATNDPLRFEYNLTTPWRGILSATAMMGQYGFITADYEYVDYGSVRYRFSNEFKEEQNLRNDILKSMFQAASNFRIGIEGRMQNLFVRGGFGYYGNPYKDSNNDMKQMTGSLGIGFRTERFFTDLAYVHAWYDNNETPYTLPYSNVVTPTAQLENKLNTIALTIGWKM
jgi:hypothetical protein